MRLKKIPMVFILVGSQNFKREGIIFFFLILESFYVCQSDRNIFYAAHNQNAVRFDVPLVIQNTGRFESVNEYRVPPIP